MCGSKKLNQFLDLGEQPLANAFLKKPTDKEKTYPLRVYWCEECNLAQLLDVVSKEELFTDYIYFSSGMPKLSKHFEAYGNEIMERFLNKDDFVVEIASNDGILLKHFQDAGYKCLGIDPAINVVEVADKLGVNTLCAFFSEELAEQVAEEHEQAKVIIANNVVAHIDDHHDLVRGVKKLLRKDGVFVLEAPYLMDMFINLSYDTIYHEHLSYLALRPLKRLFEEFGLEVFDFQLNVIQGVSLRVFVGFPGEHPVSPDVKRFTDLEEASGFRDFQVYVNLASRIHNQREELVALLNQLKDYGNSVASYGAPAKGNTMLNFCGIGPDMLMFAKEDLSVKQGLYTPGMHIKTVDALYARLHEPDYYLMLAWNYEKQILEKEQDYLKRGGHFIIPIQGIRII